MWDDHDIWDGWGSYPEPIQACPVFQVGPRGQRDMRQLPVGCCLPALPCLAGLFTAAARRSTVPPTTLSHTCIIAIY